MRELLPDSTLRDRLRIPDHIGLHGRIEMHNGAFAPVLALAVDSGTLTLKGHLTPKSQQYDLTLACDSFPAKDFLPADSLGRITLQLETRGKGFDPLVAKTQSELKLQIDRFGLPRFPVQRDRTGSGIKGTKPVRAADQPKRSAATRSRITRPPDRNHTKGRNPGSRRQLPPGPHAPDPGADRGTLTIDLTASATADKSYTATLALDKIVLWNKWETNTIRPTSLTLLSASRTGRSRNPLGRPAVGLRNTRRSRFPWSPFRLAA
ncbi:MAG: hypothetical protein ACLR8Y_20285 [Alistipes indistinctus]